MGDNLHVAGRKMRAADDTRRIRIDDPRWLASEFKRMSKELVHDEFKGPGDTLVAAADRISIHHQIDAEIILQGWKRPPRNTLVTRWMAVFRVYHERMVSKAAAYEETRHDAEKAGVFPALLRLADLVAADLADLFDDVGGLKPISEWPMAWRRGLVGGLEVEEEYDDEEEEEEHLEPQLQGGALKRRSKKKRRVAVGRISKVKLSDRVKRLELIGKHTGVRAFDRTLTVKPESGALEAFAQLIQGRSIRPVIPGAKK